MEKKKTTIDFDKPLKKARRTSKVWRTALCNLADKEKEESLEEAKEE